MKQTTKEVELGKLGKSIQQKRDSKESKDPDVQTIDYQSPRAKSTSTLCKLLKFSMNIGIWAMPLEFSKSYLTGGFIILSIAGLIQYYSWDLVLDCLEEKSRYEIPNPYKEDFIVEINSSRNTNQTFFPTGKSNFRDTSNFDKDKDEEILEIQPDKITAYRPFTINNLVEELYAKHKWFHIFVKIMTLILLQGTSMAQMIIIKECINSINPSFHQWPYQFLLFLFISIILLFCTKYKNFQQIKSSIYFGSYTTMIMVYFIFSISIYQIKLNSLEPTNIKPSDQIKRGINWINVPSFFGVALYTYDINGQISEVRKEMNHPNKFKQLLKATMIFEYILNGILGSVGYYAYGKNTKNIIMNNVSDTVVQIGNGMTIIYDIIKIIFSLSLVVTLAMKNIIGVDIFKDLIYKLFPKLKQIRYNQYLLNYSYTLFCFIIAAYIEDVVRLISILGSFAVVFLGIVLPYLLYSKSFNVNKPKLVLNTLVLILGLFGGVIELINAIIH